MYNATSSKKSNEYNYMYIDEGKTEMIRNRYEVSTIPALLKNGYK